MLFEHLVNIMSTKQSSLCINDYRGYFVILDWSTSFDFLKAQKDPHFCGWFFVKTDWTKKAFFVILS